MKDCDFKVRTKSIPPVILPQKAWSLDGYLLCTCHMMTMKIMS